MEPPVELSGTAAWTSAWRSSIIARDLRMAFREKQAPQCIGTAAAAMIRLSPVLARATEVFTSGLDLREYGYVPRPPTG
jgi:hypothetical protein